MALTGVMAAFAFVVQGIKSVGGLRGNLFENLPDYDVARRFWTSKPLSPESAEKIVIIFNKLRTDFTEYEEEVSTKENNNISKESTIKDLKSINQKLINLNIDYEHLTSMYNGNIMKNLFQTIKDLNIGKDLSDVEKNN